MIDIITHLVPALSLVAVLTYLLLSRRQALRAEHEQRAASLQADHERHRAHSLFDSKRLEILGAAIPLFVDALKMLVPAAAELGCCPVGDAAAPEPGPRRVVGYVSGVDRAALLEHTATIDSAAADLGHAQCPVRYDQCDASTPIAERCALVALLHLLRNGESLSVLVVDPGHLGPPSDVALLLELFPESFIFAATQ